MVVEVEQSLELRLLEKVALNFLITDEFLLFWTELSQGKLWKLLVEDVSQHYLYEIEL